MYPVLEEGPFIQHVDLQILFWICLWRGLHSLTWLIWLLNFDFQACSLPFSTWPPVPTSVPMRPVVRRGLRCSANSWSMCPADLFDTPSAGSATVTVRILEVSTVFLFIGKCTGRCLMRLTLWVLGLNPGLCTRLTCVPSPSSTVGSPVGIYIFWSNSDFRWDSQKLLTLVTVSAFALSLQFKNENPELRAACVLVFF